MTATVAFGRLVAPCFVNEGTTSVHVPSVRGYQFGCRNVRSFTCDAGKFDKDKAFQASKTLQPGRNQRCVACIRNVGSYCEVKTMWDQSCG